MAESNQVMKQPKITYALQEYCKREQQKEISATVTPPTGTVQNPAFNDPLGTLSTVMSPTASALLCNDPFGILSPAMNPTAFAPFSCLCNAMSAVADALRNLSTSTCAR